MPPAMVEWYVEQLKNERPGVKSNTAVPTDSRFPNTSQTRYCYQMFIDFHRCVKKRGDNYEPCQYFKNNYVRLCPGFWVEKWDEQIEKGAFPGRI